MIKKLKEKVLNHKEINQDEAVELSKERNKQALYDAANEIRQYFCQNTFELCSITNAKSGKCSEDCKWCSQSAHYKTHIKEYEIIEKKQAVTDALNNYQKRVSLHSLVTSGRKVSNKTLDQLISIYNEIREKCPIGLCASLGLINEQQIIRLKNEAHIQNYHCNLETAPSFFPKLVSTHTIEEKITTIKLAQKYGLNVCSGGIIGMGESMEQRIELAMLLRDLNIQSIPINILQPIAGTPLQDTNSLSEEELLTSIALFRFINPKANLRFAGGRMQIKAFQHKALKAGINAAITGDYLTSTGSNIQQDIKDFTYAGFTIAGRG